jgi:hypothetical protein
VHPYLKLEYSFIRSEPEVQVNSTLEVQYQASTYPHQTMLEMHYIKQHQLELELALGRFGTTAREASIRKVVEKRQQYSISLIAAITQDHVITSQFIEGGVDSTLFENFVYETLKGVRAHKELG